MLRQLADEKEGCVLKCSHELFFVDTVGFVVGPPHKSNAFIDLFVVFQCPGKFADGITSPLPPFMDLHIEEDA